MQAVLRYSAAVLLTVLCTAQSLAQFRERPQAGGFIFSSRQSDFLTALQDTLQESKPARSPALATILSAAVPGAGQIYSQRYWTLPLIWGFGYWFVRQYIGQDRKYDEWRARYTATINTPAYGPGGDAYAKYVRDFYRDQRDSFAFYLALTYVLNIVDAYVGASLYSFDVSEDLGGTANLRLQVRLPVQ